MNRLTVALLTIAVSAAATAFAASQSPTLESLKEQISARYAGVKPAQWGENVPGVRTRLDTKDKVIAIDS